MADLASLARGFVDQSGVDAAMTLLKTYNEVNDDPKFLNKPDTRLTGARFAYFLAESIADRIRADADAYLAAVEADVERWQGIRRGVRTLDKNDMNESYVSWWVFPTSMTDDEIDDYLIERGVAVGGHRCHTGDWDCCGRWNYSTVFVRRMGSRVLARQYAGRDI